jgi:asparagine synthase (glutamine-hydrolysing)
MCGIFAYLGLSLSLHDLTRSFNQIKARGPDNSILKNISDSVIFGFHRLAINDLSDLGNQPLVLDNLVLICNGEIYNHRELKERFGFETKSESDCEIILHLYKHYNGETQEFIDMLDGVFAFILYDQVYQRIIVARDPFGIRPLFYGNNISNEYFFASELKAINDHTVDVEQIPPGTYTTLTLTNDRWSFTERITWFTHNFKIDESIQSEEQILPVIRDLFYRAVDKRLMSDRPICCLLSGGLDSSLVASIVARKLPPGMKLHTFSIGMESSPDLHYARIVSEFIGSVHHEVVLTPEQFLEAIPETIRVIESYDTTSVRASVGNYLISKYISETTDFKVVYNGDGSDEFGSYMYFGNAPDELSFHLEANRLLKEICYFDVLRSDRSISSNGIEGRVPFLDKKFALYYTSIPPRFKVHTYGGIEKYILRKAFEQENLLPQEVLWRSKMAFSDGVSAKSKSWHTIINEHVDKMSILKMNYKHCQPVLKESYYYRSLFESIYNHPKVIPHFWLPNWCGNVTDPSARVLSSALNKEID